MQKRNGYFQVIRDDAGISLRLFPPENGGEPIKSEQIKKYLDKNQIIDYNFKKVTTALSDLKQELILPISIYNGYPIHESVDIEVSDDGMTAIIRFYPPSNDGQRIALAEMKNDLEIAGLRYGIDMSILMSQLNNPVYCTDFVIAKGKPTREGKSAYVTYMFKTDRKAKPKHNDDGSVDFHDLDNISHIQKDELLAKLTPADLGENGTNVFGQEVRPHSVERKTLKYGKNIRLSEDSLEIYSEVDGHAMLEGDKVFVSNTYDVPADVDNSTGDIIYDGNVIIHGNVRTGFKVKASGDIEVFGAVEGAEIISGGQVVLHHGIQGMSRGMIVAKGNVITRFIESARVHSEGYIEAEAIIQSKVAAKGDVIVKGVKGNIIGGHVRSSTLIDAKSIGSNMGISTTVEVGLDPTVQDKFINLKKEMVDKNDELKKLLQVIEVLKKRLELGPVDDEKKSAYKRTVQTVGVLRSDILSKQDELDRLTEEISENSGAKVMVSRVIFPGTKVIVSGIQHNVNEQVSRCQYLKLKGEVKASPLA